MHAADAGPAGSAWFQVATGVVHARELFAHSPADSHTHVAGRLSISYSPFRFLEVFAAVRASRDDNNRSRTPVVSTLGDVTVCVKGCVRPTPRVCIGAEGAAAFPLGGGPEASYSASATSFLLRLLGTLDFPSVPARMHLNAGAFVDHSDVLAPSSIDPAGRFSCGLNQGSRIFAGIAFEMRLSRVVTPFVEWNLEIPIALEPSERAPGFSALSASGLGRNPLLSLARTVGSSRHRCWPHLERTPWSTRGSAVAVRGRCRLDLRTGGSFSVDPCDPSSARASSGWRRYLKA